MCLARFRPRQMLLALLEEICPTSTESPPGCDECSWIIISGDESVSHTHAALSVQIGRLLLLSERVKILGAASASVK